MTTFLLFCCYFGNHKKILTLWDALELIKEFRNEGIVGIDSAGDEAAGFGLDDEVAKVYREAKKLGIRRTFHAGEAGPAANVAVALDKMVTERIGHGYRVVEDEAIYQRCLKERVHFECCPFSSYFTGAVNGNYNGGIHPIVRMAEDGANFSISKDDPTIFQTTLNDEYRYLMDMGLTEAHLVRAVCHKSPKN